MSIKNGIKSMLAVGGLLGLLYWGADSARSVSAPDDDYLRVYAKIQSVSSETEQNKALRGEALAASRRILAHALNTYALDVRYASPLKNLCAKIEPQTARIFPSRRMVDIKVIDALPPAGGGNSYTAGKMGVFTPSESQVVLAAAAANRDSRNIVRLRALILDTLSLDALYRASQYKVAQKEFGSLQEQIMCGYISNIISSGLTRPTIPPDSFPDYYHGLLTLPGQNVVNPFVNFTVSYNSFNSVKGIGWDPQSFHSMTVGGVKYANPLHLPLPVNMESKLKSGEVQAVFERLLGCVLCREFSRCFLEHDLVRLQKACSLKKRLDAIMKGSEAKQEVRRFLLYNLPVRQEHEADVYAAKLGRSIGLAAQDFEDAFSVLYSVDNSAGEGAVSGNKPHFDYVESLRTIRRVYSGEEL
ncbi:hypothetical protein IJT93_09695 [bacterium]|nr:hypothetical protein [bacterium]